MCCAVLPKVWFEISISWARSSRRVYTTVTNDLATDNTRQDHLANFSWDGTSELIDVEIKGTQHCEGSYLGGNRTGHCVVVESQLSQRCKASNLGRNAARQSVVGDPERCQRSESSHLGGNRATQSVVGHPYSPNVA